MTDATAPNDPAAPVRDAEGIAAAVQKSLKKRYARETRFKLYGVAAIGFALAVLVLLFFTIISNGYTAFVQTKVQLPIDLAQSEIDPDGSGDPEVIGKANYRSLVFNAMRGEFPSVSGRTNRRALAGLLSSGADFELREAVLDDPSLIGGVRSVWLTMSDDADVFIKGRSTDVDLADGRGRVSLFDESGVVTVTSGEDDFAQALADVKDALAEQAVRAENEAARRQGSIALFTAALNDNPTEEKAAELREDLERTRAEIIDFEARAADLRDRAAAAGGEEAMDSSMPSYFAVVNGGVVKATSVSANSLTGEVILPLDSLDPAAAGDWRVLSLETPEESRRVKDNQAVWLWTLQQEGKVETQFNTTFFTAGDSREPEQAGIWGAAVGSFWTLLVTLLLSFPIGVMEAVYLEEFAPKNRWTDLVEVNINNLAAVPSIVFGLLGLAMFLNVFGLPRSAPLVGGMVLTLMTLPTIIIASRAALKSVPPSIREAALGMGASRLQAMTHHVLPLALPGMLTGTIIGMAQALGETAPLLMIGMVAFIVDIPGGMTDPATVLPVQIFLWADAPERAFVERTSAAIMVLLGFLILMNLTAVLLRKKFETRW